MKSELIKTIINGERFADDKIIHHRYFGGEYQIYAKGLLHICMCDTLDQANLITDSLNQYFESFAIRESQIEDAQENYNK